MEKKKRNLLRDDRPANIRLIDHFLQEVAGKSDLKLDSDEMIEIPFGMAEAVADYLSASYKRRRSLKDIRPESRTPEIIEVLDIHDRQTKMSEAMMFLLDLDVCDRCGTWFKTGEAGGFSGTYGASCTNCLSKWFYAEIDNRQSEVQEVAETISQIVKWFLKNRTAIEEADKFTADWIKGNYGKTIQEIVNKN